MSAITLATLLKVLVPKLATPLLYQSYQLEPYVFASESYQHAGFEIQTYSTDDLSLGTSDVKIAIRNNQVLRSLMRQYDDLKKSIAYVYHVQPGTNVPPIGCKLRISMATTEDAMVLFTLKSPTNALVGRLSTKYIEAADFPELPYYKPAL